MGYYYGFNLKAKIKQGSDIDRLLLMLCDLNYDDNKFLIEDFPDRLLFNGGNWKKVFFHFNEFKEYEGGILTICISIKHSKCQIKHFCDWIEPYIEKVFDANLTRSSEEQIEYDFIDNKFVFEDEDFDCSCDELPGKEYIPIGGIKEYIDEGIEGIRIDLRNIFLKDLREIRSDVFSSLPHDYMLKIKEQTADLVDETHRSLVTQIDRNFERMFRDDVEEAKNKFIDECIKKYKSSPKFKKLFSDELSRISQIFSDTVNKANEHLWFIERRIEEIDRKMIERELIELRQELNKSQ